MKSKEFPKFFIVGITITNFIRIDASRKCGTYLFKNGYTQPSLMINLRHCLKQGYKEVKKEELCFLL